MGRKASLKLCLDYNLDEEEDDYYNSWYEEEENDCQLSSTARRAAETESPAARTRSNEHNQNGRERPFRGMRLYNLQPVGRPFSKLLLDHGHDSVLLHIASYLTVRSVSAWSCTHTTPATLLAQSALYCQGSTLLLPCMRAYALPNSSWWHAQPPRLLRSLALEAALFHTHGGSRERSLSEVRTIACGSGSGGSAATIILAVWLSPLKPVVAHLVHEGRLVWCESAVLSSGADGTTTTTAATTTSSRSTIVPKKSADTKRWITQECVGILASDSSGPWVAVVYMPASGVRRYVLAVRSLNPQKVVSWQTDLPLLADGPAVSSATSSSSSWYSSRSTRSLESPRVAVRIHRGWVVAVVRRRVHIWVLHTGHQLGEFGLDDKGCQDWRDWTLHDSYLVGLTERGKEVRVVIYSIPNRHLVAAGQLPTSLLQQQQRRRQPQPQRRGYFPRAASRDDDSGVDLSSSRHRVVVFDGRVWFTHLSELYCTGGVLRRLARQTSKDDNTDSSSRSAKPLTVRQFNWVCSLSHPRPLLKPFREALFVVDRNLIKVFHTTAVTTTTTVSDSSTVPPAFSNSPNYVLSAEGTIDFLEVDTLKIVCGIRDAKKHRIEIFLRPTLSDRSNKDDHNTLFHSVFVKNATVFRNRYQFTNIVFRGGLLVVEQRKVVNENEGGSGLPSSNTAAQLRVFRMFENWDF